MKSLENPGTFLKSKLQLVDEECFVPETIFILFSSSGHLKLKDLMCLFSEEIWDSIDLLNIITFATKMVLSFEFLLVLSKLVLSPERTFT